MNRCLLDVNVLLALFDELHQHHELAVAWFTKHIDAGWASCPITQNGFARIISQPRYPRPIPIAQAIAMLQEATATDHHQFWPDDVTLLDGSRVDATRIHGPKQLTDIFLLALAVKHDGCLVTFDDSMPVSAVKGSEPRHLVLL